MTADVLAGRYRLEQGLSTTTMGDVWLANDDVLERDVVVKLLAADADRPRFEREARAAAALAHPNIVQVFDYGEDEGRPYMVLEYLPGGTLAERLPEGKAFNDDETRRIATDIAAGLAHAHENGVVDRDLKPGNVLFDSEGRAKVADFGIAHVVGTDSLTDEGTVMGTAAYISPEQVAGGEPTPATDVYAFGVLLYRLLSGRFPFESENALELARMHRDIEAPPVTTFRSDAPRDLASLAMASLAKDPAARPPNGAALLAALEGAPAPTLAAGAATVGLATPRRIRRRPVTFAVAALLLAAAGVLPRPSSRRSRRRRALRLTLARRRRSARTRRRLLRPLRRRHTKRPRTRSRSRSRLHRRHLRRRQQRRRRRRQRRRQRRRRPPRSRRHRQRQPGKSR